MISELSYSFLKWGFQYFYARVWHRRFWTVSGKSRACPRHNHKNTSFRKRKHPHFKPYRRPRSHAPCAARTSRALPRGGGFFKTRAQAVRKVAERSVGIREYASYVSVTQTVAVARRQARTPLAFQPAKKVKTSVNTTTIPNASLFMNYTVDFLTKCCVALTTAR